MAIRNFWMEAHVDGYANPLRGGPLSKDGGMRIELLARNNGDKEVVLNVYCFERDGKLVVSATHDGKETFRWEGQR